MFKLLEVKDSVNQNGIGFGLTISKMIIEKLGGSLSIKSNSKNGAESAAGLTVTIAFPDHSAPKQIFENSFREDALKIQTEEIVEEES